MEKYNSTHKLAYEHTLFYAQAQRGEVVWTELVFPSLSLSLSFAVATAQSDGKQEVPNSRTSFLLSNRKSTSAV